MSGRLGTAPKVSDNDKLLKLVEGRKQMFSALTAYHAQEAAIARTRFVAYRTAGFTEEQAMQLVLSKP